MELWFQTHQCTFEFQVGSQEYEIDFKGRSVCLPLDMLTGELTVMQLLFQNVIESRFLLGCESNEGTFNGVQAAPLSTVRRGRGMK